MLPGAITIGRLARCARAVLASNGSNVGPLTVTGWRGRRCLGAWNVSAAQSGSLTIQATHQGGEWNVRRIDGDEAGVVAPFLRSCRWRQILQIESPDPSAPAEMFVPDTLCWQVVPN